MGRYEFATHHGQDQGSNFNTAVELFAPLKATGIYRTRWFRRHALLHGCTDLSYRKTVDHLNHARQQPGATTLRTLCNAAEHESARVIQYLDRRADELLAGPRFDADGRPLFQAEPGAPETSRQPSSAIATAIEKCLEENPSGDISAAQIAANPVEYEPAGENRTTGISIDDVGVKKQKPARKPGAASKGGDGKATDRKKAWTTVAHVERGQARYTLTADNVPAVLRLVSALLVASGMDAAELLFFTDGQRSLKDAIFDFWKVRGSIRLILDWYHLQHKCRELGSLGLKGSIAAKKVHIEELRRLLWHGLVDRAIAYIDALPPDAVRKPAVVDQIKGYLERNRPHIPCYAVRRELGLRCSSNPVEKENDVVVAHRQKKNGMSWSEDGSHALATLAALRRNREEERWLHDGTLAFSLTQEEAA